MRNRRGVSLRRFVRQPWLIAASAYVSAVYLRFALRTIRWRVVNIEAVQMIWSKREEGVIICFWHAGISLSTAAWPHGKAQPMRALISLSADGAFIADAIERLGVPAIRGSRRKRKRGAARSKGGAQAFREMLRWVRSGGAIAITPDGPVGPAEVMGDGPLLLAAAAHAPILPMGLATRPCLRLPSWDRAIVPLPFARAIIVWEDAIRVPRSADAETLERLRGECNAKVSAATRRAETLLA